MKSRPIPASCRLICALSFTALLYLGDAAQAAPSTVADTPDGTVVVDHPFPVPFFRLHGDDPPPLCNATYDGATLLTAKGILCVCKTPPSGAAWIRALAGGACWLPPDK